MLQMMISLSTLIEVPEDHVKRGLTLSIENKSNSEEEKLGRLIRFESGFGSMKIIFFQSGPLLF